MTSNHGPSSYEAGFLHSASAGTSPVYVPTTRVVTPMIPALPYLQTPCASQQSSPVSNHPSWGQPGTDSMSSYNHSPVSPRFTFSTSPPLSSGVAAVRETAASYSSPLNISANGREHYGARSLSGSYHSPYSAYVSPNVGATWPASPFDSPVLHGLQSGAPPGSTRHPNIGEPPEHDTHLGALHELMSFMFHCEHREHRVLLLFISICQGWTKGRVNNHKSPIEANVCKDWLIYKEISNKIKNLISHNSLNMTMLKMDLCACSRGSFLIKTVLNVRNCSTIKLAESNMENT